MLKPISLSRVEPDWDSIVQQLQNILSEKKTWKDFLTSGVGQSIIEFIAAIGELDQYSVARNFEEMFTETALLDSNVLAIQKLLGTYLRRKQPPYLELRLPDSSNVPLPIDIVSPVPNDKIFTAQWYLNPHFDQSTFDASAPPTYGQGMQFWAYGKLKREASGLNVPALTIPPYSVFSTSDGNFFNRRAIIFDSIPVSTSDPNTYLQSGWYGYHQESDGSKTPAIIYRGDIVDRVYPASGKDYFSIISSESNFEVSDEDVEVYVNNQQIEFTKTGLWEYKNLPAIQRVAQNITTSKGRMTVLFGTAMYGEKPNTGDTIRLRYAVTKGLADSVSTFKRASIASTQYNIDSTVDTLINPTVGGANEATAEEYKKIGPQLYAADNGRRAVIPQDYMTVFSDYPGVISAQVDGQRTLNPTSPKFMNLQRVVTYPKLTSQEYELMFAEVSKRTMYSNYFISDLDYPIYRTFSIRANVYCTGQVDFISIRDDYIEPAILKLVDREGEPAIGRLNYNIYFDDIISTISNAHPSIDYVELLEPSTDVFSNIVSPNVEELEFIGNSGTDANFDYAVIMKSQADGDEPRYTNVYYPNIGERRGGSPDTINVHFKLVPNFKWSQAVRHPKTTFKYLNNVQYALLKRNQATGIWAWASTWFTAEFLEANISPNHTVFIEDSDPNNPYTTAPLVPDKVPQFNTHIPSVPLLVNDTQNATTDPNYRGQWRAEGLINIFSSDRVG